MARNGDGRALAQACALVPHILAEPTAAVTKRPLVIAAAEATSTRMAVLWLAPPGQTASHVLKMPLSAAARRALHRETAVLEALHADTRLGAWRELLPRPLASGSVLDQPYRIEAALPGRPQAGRVRSPALVEGVADAMHVLHRATATAVTADEDLAARWIDARLRDVFPQGVRRPLRLRLDRLREELAGAVTGATLRAGWIHGDCWLGNVLFDSGRARPRGIVDWDAADSTDLAAHDVLHLLLYSRGAATGEQIGTIVRRQLSSAGWPARERRLLDRYAAWCHGEALSERQLLLLCWLRHVALHARQQDGAAGYRHRAWELRNVHQVLLTL